MEPYKNWKPFEIRACSVFGSPLYFLFFNTDEEEDSDDQGVDGEDLLALAESAVDVDEYGEPKARRKRKLGSLARLKKARAIKKEANEGPHRWVTCVACGKICKNPYLFKIHQVQSLVWGK